MVHGLKCGLGVAGWCRCTGLTGRVLSWYSASVLQYGLFACVGDDVMTWEV